MQKWLNVEAELIETKKTYDVKMTINLGYYSFEIYALVTSKDNELQNFIIKEAYYKDEFGKYRLSKKTLNKIRTAMYKNIFGDPETGLYLNGHLKNKLKQIVPEEA